MRKFKFQISDEKIGENQAIKHTHESDDVNPKGVNQEFNEARFRDARYSR